MNLPRSYLSPSQVNLYLRCPRQYQYRYVDGLSTNSLPSALLMGRAMHKAFEEYLQGNDDRKMLHDTFCENWDDHGDTPIEYSKKITEKNVFAKAEQMIQVLIDNYDTAQIVDTEHELTGVIGGVAVLSIADAILCSNGNKKIVEFKTTGRLKNNPSKDYGLQIGTYSLLAGIDDVEIVQLSTAKNPTLQVDKLNGFDFSNLTKNTYSQVAKAIENEIFYCQTSGWQCNYCDYAEHCQQNRKES